MVSKKSKDNIISFRELKKFLKKNKKIFPLILILGKEKNSTIINNCIEEIKNHLGKENIFFKEYLGDKELDIKKVFDELYTPPLFEDYNIIIIKNANDIIKKIQDYINEYIRKKPQKSILIITLNELSKKTALFSLIKKEGIIIECEISERISGDLIKWIEERAEYYNKNISLNAINLLLYLIGNNPNDIDIELQKLSLFIKDRKNIEEDDVYKLIQKNKRENIFNLIDSLTTKDLLKTLHIANNIFNNGIISQQGIVIYDKLQISLQCIRLIHYRLKHIWKLKSNLNDNSIPYFIKKKITPYLPYYSKRTLSLLLEKLLEIEFKIKSSSISPQLAIEEFIIYMSKL